MANLNRARGFECKGVPLRVNEYQTSAACYPGDLVKLTSSGQVGPCAAGDLILGVCLDYASTSALTVRVADHPDQLILGQVHAAEVAAQTNLFNTADILATAGDSTYKISRQEVDGSTLSASAAAQLRLLAIEGNPKNAFGTNVMVVCAIDKHVFGAAAANAAIGV